MIFSHRTLRRLFKQSLFTASLTISILALARGASGATIIVPAGGDLQAAINVANCGDVILVRAGATFSGNFMLPEDIEGLVWLLKHLFVGLVLYLIFRVAQLAEFRLKRWLDRAGANQRGRKKREKPQSRPDD